ncbi:MAG: tRNA (adenosine(37)-N6)-threonylcarbamoyltransferase complex dimerization subunit type 1 TsaB [Actinomycetaceae bacterium]|nr:tRNA (adenosine(37)-N6)-threonylcarbamoyltransferase complex dimerization subunit type 1 TsaB [Actinomycetaceae bacterium]
MITLSIDTSAASAVAWLQGDKAETTLSMQVTGDARHHVETLSETISATKTRGGLDAQERADLIVVGRGPAPFTGLRAGIMTALTLGAAWQVPVVGVCSLDALALQVLRDLEGKGAAGQALQADEVTVIFSDARRQEVYYRAYRTEGRGDLRGVLGPFVGSAKEAIETLAEAGLRRCACAGRGVELYDDALREAAQDFGMELRFVQEEDGLRVPNPALAGRLAWEHIRGAVGDVAADANAEDLLAHVASLSPKEMEAAGLHTTPDYLRRPDIHMGKPKT